MGRDPRLMGWLLAKDLRILRRSPLVGALLAVYPVVVAVLLGLALSGGPDRPRVAFANLVDPGDGQLRVGGQRLDLASFTGRLFASIEPVVVDSRAEALERVREGEVLAALVVPADLTQRLQATLDLAGSAPPAIEVIYNAEDPVKRRYVEAAIESRLAEANRALSARVTALAAASLEIIVRGGELSLLGQEIDILGLRRSAAVLRATLDSLPADAPERVALEQVERFAELASQNLDVSRPILASISEPVRVRRSTLAGGGASLDAFAVAVAVTVSLAFVALLLGAGMLALEREEHAFGRLARGLVSRTQLVGAKLALGAVLALAVALVLLGGLAALVGLDWGRAPAWLAAAALGALAFAGLGVALGALAREVRAASLLAFALALPLAFGALVPSGTVAPALHDAIGAVSALFPFKPTLDALDAALSGGGLAGPLAHLAALTLAFAALARAFLRGI